MRGGGVSVQMDDDDHEDEPWVHSVEITGVTSGAISEFKAGVTTGKPSSERFFRTLPNDGQEVTFTCGGDMDIEEGAQELMQIAKELNPLFAVIGGDLVYMEFFGNDEEVQWDDWLDNWEQIMITSDGCTIPIVLAIGDH